MSIVIREALYSDLPDIGRILVVSWRAAYRGIVPDAHLDGLTPAAREARLRAQWDAGRRWPAVVLLDGGEAVGVCAYGKGMSDDIPDTWGEIGTCYLLPSHWGRGLGGRLIRRAEGDLRAMGCARAVIWVLEDNARARRAYERAGYAPDGAAKTVEIGGVPLREVRYGKSL